jgi:hypothetical protein
MNDTPAPMTAEQVDDLLSAELDGEFAAAATDLGLDEAEARARLDATPGVAERRAQLAAASAAIGDVPELDDVTEARLRSAAVGVADIDVRDVRKRRRRAWMSAVGGAAAVVVVVLGIAAAAHHNSSSGETSNAAAESPSRHIALAPTTGVSRPFAAFGKVASADALQGRVRAALTAGHGAESLHSNAQVPAVGVNAGASVTTLITNASSSDYFDVNGADIASADNTYTAVQNCDPAARLAADSKTPPVLYATATLNHQPVTVFVYAHGTEYVIIASDKGCKVVLHRTIDR